VLSSPEILRWHAQGCKHPKIHEGSRAKVEHTDAKYYAAIKAKARRLAMRRTISQQIPFWYGRYSLV